MPPVLTIDAGTTGVRAMVVRDDGSVASRAYREFPQSFPRPGWVEHDPEDWWRALLEVDPAGAGRRRHRRDGPRRRRDHEPARDDRPVGPGHHAARSTPRSSGRTAGRPALCDTLRDEGWEERIRDRTGLVIDPYFSGTKLAWLLDHVEEAREGAAAGRARVRDGRLLSARRG